MESTGADSPLYVRGNHKTPGDKVTRRFLEAFDTSQYDTQQSGRLQLANDIASESNPLFARVAVNRIWQHLFGRGLVATPDNFGQMGERPSHPALLDHLAHRLIGHEYSIKDMIRYIVSSNAWQQQSVASNRANEIDPDNRLLSHANVRRLEAEAIRDSMLAVSGRLRREQFVGSRSDQEPFRSVYVRVRRNSPSPMLTVFDLPVPFTTKGNRDVTNVPAQSLTLMNDPFITGLSKQLGDSIAAMPNAYDDAKAATLFLKSLGRLPTRREIEATMQFLKESTTRSTDVQTEVQRLRTLDAELSTKTSELLTPVRERILAERDENSDTTKSIEPPIARWEFEGNLQDSIGELHGSPVNNATVRNGRLILDGRSFVRTTALTRNVQEKTLEVWVQLTNLNQRGGGAMTLQTPDGVIFDSIVFGEREPRRWMPGTNGFSRTKDVGGMEERELKQPIHIAITYKRDGTVTMYRNGLRYGQPYKTGVPITYKQGNANLIFGMRHGTTNRPTSMLQGEIELAQLYDRVLSADEIQASALGREFVAESQLIAAMNAEEKQEWQQLKDSHADLAKKLEQFKNVPEAFDANSKWHDLAHAIFNFKEFIYVR